MRASCFSSGIHSVVVYAIKNLRHCVPYWRNCCVLLYFVWHMMCHAGHLHVGMPCYGLSCDVERCGLAM